jgi:hypothetical protein
MEHIQKITQAYSQTPWRKQVRMIGIFLLGVVIVATVASVYLNVRARTVALGRELQWMQVHIIDYYAITAAVEDDVEKKAEQAANPKVAEEEEEEPDIIPIEELERNISLLQTQLAYLTSYQVMAARAQDMGLVPVEPENIVYLEIAGYVEPQPAVLAPPPQQVVVSASGIDPAFRQSLFDWLGDQIQQTLKLFNGVKP